MCVREKESVVGGLVCLEFNRLTQLILMNYFKVDFVTRSPILIQLIFEFS
jgi:hypothetical protein